MIGTIDRTKFYGSVRKSLFGGSMTGAQVAGMNNILDYVEKEYNHLPDRRYVSYPLATTYHETDKTMQPIEEYGGLNKRYAPYYGRGLVQLTWDYNYRREGIRLNLPLLQQPQLALDPNTSVNILFHGMTNGSFTGKSLSDYFNEKANDAINARRIINSLDRATEIAGYHRLFLAALS